MIKILGAVTLLLNSYICFAGETQDPRCQPNVTTPLTIQWIDNPSRLQADCGFITDNGSNIPQKSNACREQIGTMFKFAQGIACVEVTPSCRFIQQVHREACQDPNDYMVVRKRTMKVEGQNRVLYTID